MLAETVLVKTAKGAEEIQQRGHHLSGKLRALLITVDGRSAAGEIARRSLAPAETLAALEQLLADGYVAERPTAAAPAAAGRSSLRELPRESPLLLAQRFMASSMIEALGPEADHFAVHIEEAQTMAELAALAGQYLEVMRVGGGARRAEAFRAGCVAHGLLAAAAPASQPPA